MSEKDALDNLIVDEEENPNIKLLAEIISKYLRFDKKSGEMIFNQEFYKNLRGWQKILIYLLGRKVIVIKRLQEGFEEKISPKNISLLFGIPAKSITRARSRELKDLIKSDNGKYFVPNYNLYKCGEILNIK